MDDLNFIKEPNPKKRLLVIVTTLALITVCLIGGAIYMSTRPNMVFLESYNYLMKNFQKETADNNPIKELLSTNNRVKMEMNANMNFHKDLDFGVENILFKLTSEEDKEKQISGFGIQTEIDNKEFLNLNTYNKEDKLYIYLKDIMDKYYSMPFTYTNDFDNLNPEDVNILAKILSSAIQKYVRDSSFEKTTITKEIDGKDEKVKKISLEVTDTLLMNILTECIDKIQNNNEALDALARITGQDRTDLEGTLVVLKENLDNGGDKEYLFTYNIYYKGTNEIRMLEIEGDGTTLSFSANDHYIHVKFVYIRDTLFELKIEEEEDHLNIDIAIEDVILTGTYQESEEKATMKLTAKEKEEVICNLTMTTDNMSETEEKVEILIENEGIELCKVTLNTKYTFGEEINEDFLKNAKDMEDLTPEEAEDLVAKLEEHPLLSLFMSLFDTSYDDDDEFNIDDLDYDYGYDSLFNDIEEDTVY